MAPLRHLRRVRSTSQASTVAAPVTVAFATADRKHVDQHFGSAGTFAVYEIGPGRAELVELIQFTAERRDGNEDKLQVRIEKLAGCAAVYCEAIGASAVRQLMTRGIQPVCVIRGAHIGHLLGTLRDELRRGPSGWLARAVAPREDRFDAMEAEGWVE